ncbi:MFS transporter [Anaerovoracaceae bacterium 42-11]
MCFLLSHAAPFLMQSGMGMSPFNASMVLFPAILLSCVIAPLAGRIYGKKGGRVLLPLGFLCIGVCTAALSLVHTESSIPLAVLYIPVICGSALIIGPVQSFALGKLSPQKNPHGVTVMSTGFQIAGCIGSSLFSGVFGLFASEAQGFSAVGFLATAFAAVGLILAVYITRD